MTMFTLRGFLLILPLTIVTLFNLNFVSNIFYITEMNKNKATVIIQQIRNVFAEDAINNASADVSWKIVSFPGCEDLLLVSAYFDSRYRPPRVAVIAGVDWKCGLTVSCLLKSSTGDSLTTDVQVYVNPEAMNTVDGFRYQNDQVEPLSSFLLECLIPESHCTRVFTSLSLMLNNSSQTLLDVDQQILKHLSYTNETVVSDSLAIQYPKHRTPTRAFTVCQQTTKYNFGNRMCQIHQLIEFVETNAVFGASMFIFYAQSMTTEYEHVLKHYEGEELLQMKDFRIPDYIGSKLRGRGQLLVLMDCFYEHMWDSEYLVHMDPDERLVPMGNFTSWNEIVRFIKLHVDPNFSSLNFKNVFFPREGTDFDDTFPRNHTYGLIESPVQDRPMFVCALGYTNRYVHDYPYGERSKYIADPRRVMLPGTHFPHAEFNSTRRNHTTRVPIDIGLIFHYRVLDQFLEAKVPQKDLIEESRMLKFKPMIVNKIKERLVNLVGENIWV